MTTTIEFKAWLDSPLTKAMKQNHKEAVKAEREACAKVCDEIVARYRHADDAPEMVAANWCADGVRARGSV
jgi:hypothetical protein